MSGGKLAPATPLWAVAFDNLLIRGCAFSLDCLEETLRLLDPAGALMPADELARAVEATLERSKKLRRRGNKRRAGGPEQLEYEPGGRGGLNGPSGYSSGGYTSGGGYASAGVGGGGYSSASDGSMRSAPIGKARRTGALVSFLSIAPPPSRHPPSLSSVSNSPVFHAAPSLTAPSLFACQTRAEAEAAGAGQGEGDLPDAPDEARREADARERTEAARVPRPEAGQGAGRGGGGGSGGEAGGQPRGERLDDVGPLARVSVAGQKKQKTVGCWKEGRKEGKGNIQHADADGGARYRSARMCAAGRWSAGPPPLLLSGGCLMSCFSPTQQQPASSGRRRVHAALQAVRSPQKK